MWSFLNKTGCYQDRASTIITRCPFCGDSKRKLRNYGHLYISKEFPFFVCFRCNQRGHIKKLLTKFIETKVCNIEEAKKVLSLYGDSKTFKNIKSSKLYYKDLNSEFNKQQLAYLKFRIGKDLDYESYKIVSPKFLIEKTNFMNLKSSLINKLKNNLNALEYLKNNYIAFLSHWNSIIILRHIYPGEPRYIQIYTENHDSYDFYLGNEFLSDYQLSQHNQFIISEGVFDILNQRVSFNRDPDYIKIAVFGKSRLAKGLSIVRSFFAEIKRIFLYLDKDVKEDKFMLNLLLYAYKDVIVKFLYNAQGKDMGEEKILIKQLNYRGFNYGKTSFHVPKMQTSNRF